MDSLKLPENYIDIPIKAFEIEETKNLLTKYFPNSTVEEIKEFHELTHGTPRVQAYALDLKEMGLKN